MDRLSYITMDKEIGSLDRDAIYSLLANSIKGRHKCEEARKVFVVSRTFPVAKIYDPTFIESQTRNFIDCYHGVVADSQGKCKSSFEDLKFCVHRGLPTNGIFPPRCVDLMEKYINC